MMSMSDWNIVTRSMRHRFFSSMVTVLSVSIACGLVTLLVSMRSAGENSFKRGTGNVQMLISKEPGPLPSVLNSMFYAQAPGNPITWAQYLELKGSYPFAWAIPTQLGDSYRDAPVMSTDETFFNAFEPAPGRAWALRAGALFAEPFEVVVGSDAAQRLGLEIGDGINLEHGAPRTQGVHQHDEFEFVVVGILEPTGTAHDRALFTQLESSWILHAHDRREAIFGHGITTTADDLIDDDMKITAIYASLGPRKAALVQVLSALRRDPNWTVANPADTVGGLFSIVSNIDQVLLAMAIAVMLSSGVSILLALYNSMEQRRRQIAVLRVLGASRARVFGLVLTESGIIGFLGGVLGIVLAFGAGLLVTRVLAQRVGIVVEPALPIDGYLIIVLGTVALSSIAGVIPAIVAYRTSVVHSLRPIG
jgi:putative ABC transport system permease protein